ncbi:hypothetical protein L3X38_036067 [Prunus dulcis]|uniref:TATA binding protein 2 n=1 Tax=Prunus dulcis TaxID=3755 RepID=A0AAD4YPA0_PRUDU|nr:hypothetical protein L3X38_036067 [Prunus dulcis]
MTVLLKPWKRVKKRSKLGPRACHLQHPGTETLGDQPEADGGFEVLSLDLRQIALEARNAEYNPKCFATVIVRIREPKTTALIFASGKMVCTGTKSEQQSEVAARKDFKIQNIVGSCDVKFPIRLECLAYSPMGPFQAMSRNVFQG